MVFVNSGILRGGGLVPFSVSSPGPSHCPGQLFSRSALEGRGPCTVKQVRLGSQRGDVRATCPFLGALQVDMGLVPLAVAWWTPSLSAINRPAFLEREVMGARGLAWPWASLFAFPYLSIILCQRRLQKRASALPGYHREQMCRYLRCS